jgi:hypothetical protein
MLVFENFSLYPLAHRLKSGYSSVLPVSVTVPPEGFSTVFRVTLAAEAAVAKPIAVEPSASPDAMATSTPRFRRAARIDFFTDFLPRVGVGVGLSLALGPFRSLGVASKKRGSEQVC